MRIARVTHGATTSYARLSDEGAHLLDAAPWVGGRESGETIREYDLAVPVEPSKIVCVGRNYHAHAAELGNEVPKLPLLFMKPPSALLPHAGLIELPPESERVDYEGEIALVVGTRSRRVSEDEARERIFGLTCANDVTARDLQRADVQFTRSKGFDTFCPLGPWIETELGPLDSIEVKTRVGGEVRQSGRSDQMMWGIAALVAYISGIMTLEPGDLILTGTPQGVAPLHPGQVVEVEVGGIGVLRSRVTGSTVS